MLTTKNEKTYRALPILMEGCSKRRNEVSMTEITIVKKIYRHSLEWKTSTGKSLPADVLSNY